MPRRYALLLVALLWAGLTACRPIHGQRISREMPPTPPPALARGVDPSETSACLPATAVAPPVTGSHLQTVSTAYRDLLTDYFRSLDPAPLLTAAWQGATAEALREEGSDPGVASPQFSDGSADATWQSFAGAYDLLVQRTDGHVDQVRMAFAAVAQMATSVQEGHTYFVTPDAFAQEGKETQISGIGVVLTGKEAPFTVSDLVTGGPADRAGIRPGDTITAVDGCDVHPLNSMQLSSRVRGPAGTPVHIRVNRPEDGSLDFDLTRAQITFPALESRMLANGIGLVRLHSFPAADAKLQDGRTIGPELEAALASFRAAGARGWVLDLRSNPGGRVDGLQAVAGRVLPAGTIFSFSDRGGHTTVEQTNGSRVATPPLLAVLVNGQTASAGEILASAVQDERVAPVIGSRTAGIANGATLVPIGDGAGMSITHWQTLTVHGRPLNGDGVTPDIPVERTPADLAAGVDPPLDRALQLAR